MGIIEWPEDVDIGRSLACSICGQYVPITYVTIGVTSTGRQQAFSCAIHLGMSESTSFLRAWVDFLIQKNVAYQGEARKGEGIQLWRTSSLNIASSLRG